MNELIIELKEARARSIFCGPAVEVLKRDEIQTKGFIRPTSLTKHLKKRIQEFLRVSIKARHDYCNVMFFFVSDGSDHTALLKYVTDLSNRASYRAARTFF